MSLFVIFLASFCMARVEVVFLGSPINSPLDSLDLSLVTRERCDIADRAVERQPLLESSDEVPTASNLDAFEETHSGFREEVTKHTTIDARVVTETVTTTFSDQTDEQHGDTIRSVNVDTSVSYVHAFVEQDGAVKEAPHVDDYPTFSRTSVEEESSASESKDSTHALEIQFSTGYAALAGLSEGVENAGMKDILPSGIEKNFNLELRASELATEDEQPAQVSDPIQLDTGGEISPAAYVVQAQQPVPVQDADASCCLPNSKWLWGRWKPTIEGELPVQKSSYMHRSCSFDKLGRLDCSKVSGNSLSRIDHHNVCFMWITSVDSTEFVAR